MLTEEEIQNLIERYYREELDESELKSFIEKVKSEEEFAKKVKDYFTLALAFKSEKAKNLKAGYRRNLFRRRLFFMLIAILVIVSVLLYYFSKSKNRATTIYQKYFVENDSSRYLFTADSIDYQKVSYAISPDNKVLLKKGVDFCKSSNFNSAIQQFNQLLKSNDSVIPAIYYRGLAHLEMRNFKSAKSDFEKVVIGAGTDTNRRIDGYWYLILSQIRLREYDEAKLNIDILLQQDKYKDELNELLRAIP